jgi:hypothetical protein
LTDDNRDKTNYKATSSDLMQMLYIDHDIRQQSTLSGGRNPRDDIEIIRLANFDPGSL